MHMKTKFWAVATALTVSALIFWLCLYSSNAQPEGIQSRARQINKLAAGCSNMRKLIIRQSRIGG